MTATSLVLTIDVAHPARKPEEVESMLLNALSRVRNTPSLALLKVIHGYGSTGTGGQTRDTVRNWLFRHTGWSRAVIEGESLSPLHEALQTISREMESPLDLDLISPNPGITVVWVRK